MPIQDKTWNTKSATYFSVCLSRLLLIQEKEQLLRELRSIDPKGRSEADLQPVKERITQLQNDIHYAQEITKQQIKERYVSAIWVYLKSH